MKWLLFAMVVLVYLLHQDHWLWKDRSLVLGMPVGLGYHALYCILCAGMMALLVRFAWPADLEQSVPEQSEPLPEAGPK